MLIGYARVSTKLQDTKNQQREIEKYISKNFKKQDRGLTFISEVVSAGKKKRQIFEIIENMQSDDTLIVYDLSRLARSTVESANIINLIIEKKASLIVIKDNVKIDMGAIHETSKLIVDMLSSFAEFERKAITRRVQTALDRKKAEGVKLGRPNSVSKSTILRKHGQGVKQIEIARQLGVTRQYVSQVIKEKKAI